MLSTKDIAKKKHVDPQRKAKAKQWVQSVTGRSISGDFFDAIKDGVVLCELLNKIRPGTVKGKIKKGQAFAERANVSNFVSGCGKLGVPQTELFETRDLYEKQRLAAVIQCIFGLSAQAKKIGFRGPFIAGGVSYGSSNKRNFTQAQLNKSKSAVPKMMKGDIEVKGKGQHDSYGVVKNSAMSKQKISGVQSVWSSGAKNTNTGSNHDSYGIVKNMNKPKKNYKHSNVQGVWSSGAKNTNTGSNHDSYGIVKNMNQPKTKHSNVQGVWSSGAKNTNTSSNHDSYGIVKNMNQPKTKHSNVQSVWQKGGKKTDTSSKHDSYGIVKNKNIKPSKAKTTPWNKHKKKTGTKSVASKWEKKIKKNNKYK